MAVIDEAVTPSGTLVVKPNPFTCAAGGAIALVALFLVAKVVKK